VTFTGTDVFGRTLTAKYLLQTPAHTLTPKPIAGLPGDPRPPLGDPIRGRMAAARAILDMTPSADPAIAALAKTIMTALTQGTAPMDMDQALTVLNLIGFRGW
jgi:hypothetical protein